MKLKSNWSEVELWQWIDLQTLSEESVIERYLQILSILTEQDVDQLGSLTAKELVDFVNQMQFLKNEPSRNHKPIEGFKHILINSMTLGEFIDLEHYNERLDVQSAILFRKYKVDEWDNEIFEPYIYNPENRASFFQEQSIESIYGVLCDYLAFRKTVKESYTAIFEPPIEEDEDDTFEEDEKPDSFGWERLIYSLCDEDITKFNKVTELPLVFVLNHITMKSVK